MFNEINIPSNPGILSFDIPNLIFKSFKEKILQEVDHLSSLPPRKANNKKLVGQIASEVTLDCPGNLKLFLLDSALKYQEHFKYKFADEFVLDNLWANYQKKYEYNPIHIHTGDISFIIFIQIPFELANEDNLENTKMAQIHTNGRLGFVYQTLFNSTQTFALDIDKNYVGKMLMFPNTAMHTVYPFYTSDDYRITVSGNIRNRGINSVVE